MPLGSFTNYSQCLRTPVVRLQKRSHPIWSASRRGPKNFSHRLDSLERRLIFTLVRILAAFCSLICLCLGNSPEAKASSIRGTCGARDSSNSALSVPAADSAMKLSACYQKTAPHSADALPPQELKLKNNIVRFFPAHPIRISTFTDTFRIATGLSPPPCYDAA